MQHDDYTEKLKDILSDHFEDIDQPVSVSLGLHLKGQTIEDIVNLLRDNGIKALPYYDKQVRTDLSCFVVDGTGIRSPFFKDSKDAVNAASDMFEIMYSNGVETSRAMPVTKDNLIEATLQPYTDNIIDVSQNNPNKENVDYIISSYLKYALDKMQKVKIPNENDEEYTSKTHIYRGGFLGNKPYALTFHRRYRDCAYGTNRIAEAMTYSEAANKTGLHYKEVDGMSYGFIYEFKQKEGQVFYDMAGAERPHATQEEKQTAGRVENRDDYETLILKKRNPLSAIYLRVNDELVQIHDGNGYIKTEGVNWEKFSDLHIPYNTSELNEYLVERMNRQITEFPVTEYHNEEAKALESYNKKLNIEGLVFGSNINQTANRTEISDISLNSLTITDTINGAILKNNLTLNNCRLSPSLEKLDASNCNGNIFMSNMEYIDMKLPQECNIFALSCVSFNQREVLDLSTMKCKNMVIEDVDFSALKKVILPQGLKEVKFKYGVEFPEHIDFNDAQCIVFTGSAKPNYSKTQTISTPQNVKLEFPNIPNDPNRVLFKMKQLTARKNVIKAEDNVKPQSFVTKDSMILYQICKNIQGRKSMS